MLQLIEVASSGTLMTLGYLSWLLDTGIPQMEWPALSPENLWDQLSHRVEARNSVNQNLNDLRAALQEGWDAMPQQTISRHVNSMRRQAVNDARGHKTSY